MKSMIKTNQWLIIPHCARSIKYDYINILTWAILKKIQILNGSKTFAFKYIFTHSRLYPYIFVQVSKEVIFSASGQYLNVITMKQKDSPFSKSIVYSAPSRASQPISLHRIFFGQLNHVFCQYLKYKYVKDHTLQL